MPGDLEPSLVDWALKQTWERGSRYATMPEPVFDSWLAWASRNGSAIPLAELCIGPVNEERLWDVYTDDAGDTLLCLLASGHSGQCGYVRSPAE